MNLIDFPTYARISAILWILGLILVYAGIKKEILSTIGAIIVAAGTLVMALFIARLWILLERPPMRTLGETRLWYVLFLPLIGVVFYFRWKYKWFNCSICRLLWPLN